MLVLAETWANAATLIVVVVSVAAVVIVAMLCGWKPWTRPSFWERSHAQREDCPRGDTDTRID
jgi:hypothetical protein